MQGPLHAPSPQEVWLVPPQHPFSVPTSFHSSCGECLPVPSRAVCCTRSRSCLCSVKSIVAVDPVLAQPIFLAMHAAQPAPVLNMPFQLSTYRFGRLAVACSLAFLQPCYKCRSSSHFAAQRPPPPVGSHAALTRAPPPPLVAAPHLTQPPCLQPTSRLLCLRSGRPRSSRWRPSTARCRAPGPPTRSS